MMDMNELEDKKIREYFAKDKIMNEETKKIFDDNINKIYEEKIKNKREKPKMYFTKRWMTVAASLIVIFTGAHVYANTKGYDNIFFLVKEVWKDNSKAKKEDFFIDKDIIISYKSFFITDSIEMQINRLQINKNNASLYLYVKESEENEISPFEYKVYNEDNSICFYGKSSKLEEEKSYNEVLDLKNYIEEQKQIKLQVFSKDSTLLKTVIIDLEEKTIEARTENIKVEQISQVKLNEFLSNEILKTKEENYDKKILILKLLDITYDNEKYIVKYLYSEVTDEDIESGRVEESDIYEDTLRFFIEDGEYKKEI